ncbi:putative p44-9 outer membrane protein, silent [Anaplasma phagocytophilum str. ApMUC09]|uniref:Putative p44-9 outer membrane protein, silent n=1 Tax=Anaplasma phagocytophilum str. ApMUC09 TaxID=1359152 RepID=A0A0F3N8T2_ANAPH|nr:putative p44-9 outer membrane protein, silent [Anaplasma phagocytophilum str. ApMUC09]SCV63375.1 hypothetical protein ANAPH2_00613 [Anaplasma phagocytophilum]
MEISHPTIDGKVCNGSHAQGTETPGNASINGYAAVGASKSTHTAQCSGLYIDNAKGGNGGLTKFINKTKVEEGKNWPTGSYRDNVGGVREALLMVTPKL